MNKSTSEKTLPKYQSFAEFVSLMALLVAITALSIDAVLPALAVIGQELGVVDVNHTQYIISALFLGFTFGQIIYGPVSDSFGRKFSVYIGLSIFIAGSVLSCVANSLWVMLLGRVLQGVGAASPRITSVAMVRDLYKGRDMARVMSFVMAVFIFVPAIAPSLGQAVLLFAHWRAIFLVFLIVAIVALFWTYNRLPETLNENNRRPFTAFSIWQGISEVVSNRVTLGYTVCAGLIFGAFIGYLSSARQIFQDFFHVGEFFPLYFAVSALSIGVASIVNSSIVRRYGMRRICHYALITMMLAALAFTSLLLFSSERIEVWKFMFFAPVIFFCFGLLFGNLNALAMEPMGHFAGTASAVIGSLSSAISLTVGTVIGQAYNNTLLPFLLGILCVSTMTFTIHTVLGRQESGN